MGLASKMALAQAGKVMGAPAPGGQSGQLSQSSYAPTPQQYQQSNSNTAPPQNQGQQGGQYGAPQGGQQQQYGQQQASSGQSLGGQSNNQQSQPQGQQQYNQAPQGQGQYGQQGQQGQQQQYGQPQGQGQQQYGQPQGQQGQGQGQANQYQQPPQQQQQSQQQSQQQQPPQQQFQAPPVSQYGSAPPAAGGPGIDAIMTILRTAVQEQKLGAFYNDASLHGIAQNVERSGALAKVAAEWNLPMELAMDLVRLALFDVIIYADDSGSMSFAENGERIDDLKMVVGKVSYATSLFDQDGIQVRFMNSNLEGNGIRSEQEATHLISQIKFAGLTPLGTNLKRKVLDPLVIQPAKNGQLQKPVLIISVTDGEPGGEGRFTIVDTIKSAVKDLGKTRYGSDAVSFQFAQIGNDAKARAFLEELDKHPQIGSFIDTTSNYENEQDDMAKARPPVDLTPEMWLVKMLMGAIDDSYDAQDE